MGDKQNPNEYDDELFLAASNAVDQAVQFLYLHRHAQLLALSHASVHSRRSAKVRARHVPLMLREGSSSAQS